MFFRASSGLRSHLDEAGRLVHVGAGCPAERTAAQSEARSLWTRVHPRKFHDEPSSVRPTPTVATRWLRVDSPRLQPRPYQSLAAPLPHLALRAFRDAGSIRVHRCLFVVETSFILK